MGQGLFESDEDYSSRIAEEASQRINERTLEEIEGSAPSQGWFESDDDYRGRISQEANDLRNERVLEEIDGSVPSQGFFEGDDDYRGRISREANEKINERVLEEIDGSAPSQGFFEGDDDYRSRISREAHERIHERILKDANGSPPSQGVFESDNDYRTRISQEASEWINETIVDDKTGTAPSQRDYRERTGRIPTSPSTGAHGSDAGSGSSGSPGSVGASDTRSNGGVWLVVLLILAALTLGIKGLSEGAVLRFSGVASSKAEAPNQLVDEGVCPYESCTYGEQWLAKQDVEVYFAPPLALGIPASSLRPRANVRAGQWVTTRTGIVIASRHDGRVDLANRTPVFGNGRGESRRFNQGQIVALYGYVGEGCWRSWIDGKVMTLCGVEAEPDRRQEWWVEIKTHDGVLVSRQHNNETYTMAA